MFTILLPVGTANAWHVCDRGGSYYYERSQRAEACREAAEQGDAEAQLKYGLMLVSGPRDKRDIQGAVKWIRASAENGRRDAQLLLGGILSEAKPNDEHHDLEVSARDDEIAVDNMEPFTITENQEALPDVIPPELRAETRSGNNSYGIFGSIFWTLAILLMIVTGLLQYAYYDRLRLVQYDELRPWLVKLCNYAQCDLPDPRDPKRIELSSKNIYTHPNSDNALMVSATMVNQAEFEQDFPVLELRFENIRGELIAGRQFKPDEYLGIPQEQIAKMQPGNPVSFNIEIIDPGKDVMSYEFNFL